MAHRSADPIRGNHPATPNIPDKTKKGRSGPGKGVSPGVWVDPGAVIGGDSAVLSPATPASSKGGPAPVPQDPAADEYGYGYGYDV